MTDRMTLREWFEAAVQRAPDARAEFIATCADEAMRERLVQMLAADAVDEGESGTGAEALAHRIGCTDWRSSLPPGSRIGPFELIEVLGEGGFSTVFRAVRSQNGVRQEVALKLLRRGLHTPEAQRQFRRERLALAQLKHPGIAHLIEGGVTDAGIAYIALELIAGKPITEHAREHRLDLRARLALFLKTGRAVEAAHRALIVHRDLKPSNVLVTDAGDVKLLDFGIAKLLGGDEDETRTHVQAFTPAYAAPEQKSGGAITTATDVYAMGVLLGELMTGERLSCGRRLSREISDHPAPGVLPAQPRTTRRLLQGDLDTIVMKALADEPLQRYASAGAFADDVQRLLEGRPVAAHPPTRWYRARKFVARHKGGVASSVAFLLALFAALGAALWQAHVARSEARRANAMGAFMIDAFEQAKPGAPRDGPPRITEVVQQAIASARADRGMNPRVRAELVTKLGAVLAAQGDVAGARDVLQWNHARAREDFGDGARETLESGLQLADTIMLAGDYALARDLLDGLLAQVGGGDPKIGAWLRLQSAKLASKQGEIARAVTDAEEGMRQLRRVGDDSDLDRALDVYGNVRLEARDTTAAIAAWNEGLALRERRYGARHLNVAASHAALSRVHRREGRLDQAGQHIRAALAIDEAILPAEHWRRANHLNALMMVQLAQREFRAALDSASESLRIHRALFGDGDHPEVANDLNSVGMLNAMLGNYPAAVTALRESLGRHVARFGAEHSETAVTRANLGVVLAGTGDVRGGEAEILHAIASLEATAEPSLDEQVATWVKLARVRLDRGDAGAALSAIDRIDALRTTRDTLDAAWRDTAGVLRASALIALGRAAEARALLDAVNAALAVSSGTDPELRAETALLGALARHELGEPVESSPSAALGSLRNPPLRLIQLAERLPRPRN